ncbi:MAG: glycerol kinase GlpK [Spirochaetales bacterium]|nr:glycerol kinase GlpK [Spirochaetales bacterium]
MEKYILAFDQGTTSSRTIVFDHTGNIIAVSQKEFTQYYPKPGWVEHDPVEIWQTQISTAREALKKAGIEAGQVSAIGITNQRETTVLWEKDTGKPVYNAIVWQCRRTADICSELKTAGLEDTIRKKTGLLLDPYFSGTKVKWIFENVPGIRKRAENSEILFGTVDSWLIYKLTGNHATEPSNASRTLLYNISTGDWDSEILKELKIPQAILPRIIPSSGNFGKTKKNLFGKEIPVTGVAGDQQAALFGQTCFENGSVKITYGTGCFTLMNTGKVPVFSKNKLLTTVAWDIGKGREYALEGSIFIAGAVIQWLRDELKIIDTAPLSEKLALSVKDTGGVYFVPAFVGLGAPYWDPDVRGTIVGLTRGTNRAHLVRAALESIAFQSKDLINAMEQDVNSGVETVKADGGASLNSFLMQFQADLLNKPVILPQIAETTALGAAYLAGLYTGYWENVDDIKRNWKVRKKFSPSMEEEQRKKILKMWTRAVETAEGFKPL